jgi:hypothetical protein
VGLGLSQEALADACGPAPDLRWQRRARRAECQPAEYRAIGAGLEDDSKPALGWDTIGPDWTPLLSFPNLKRAAGASCV